MRALDGVLLVAVTAGGSDADLACFVAAGFDLGLSPPFDPEQLRALVARGVAHSLGA
jgi:hypothetical protein